MADIVSVKQRSNNMKRIRAKNTKPELRVRSLLHKMGYRFRLHGGALPGKPDIVLPRYKTAIFVHGCFWHMHGKCRDGTMPKSNVGFWSEKFINNKKRDIKNMGRLKRLGWKVLRFWECEIEKKPEIVSEALRGFLKVEALL